MSSRTRQTLAHFQPWPTSLLGGFPTLDDTRNTLLCGASVGVCFDLGHEGRMFDGSFPTYAYPSLYQLQPRQCGTPQAAAHPSGSLQARPMGQHTHTARRTLANRNEAGT